jgi:hypothetical protein
MKEPTEQDLCSIDRQIDAAHQEIAENYAAVEITWHRVQDTSVCFTTDYDQVAAICQYAQRASARIEDADERAERAEGQAKTADERANHAEARLRSALRTTRGWQIIAYIYAGAFLLHVILDSLKGRP